MRRQAKTERRGTGGRRLPIRDHAALAKVFETLEHASGSQRKAARRILTAGGTLSNVQFCKHRNGRGGAHLTESLFIALTNTIRRAAQRSRGSEEKRLKVAYRTLFSAVATPDGIRLLNELWQPWLYEAWKPWAPESTRRRLKFARGDARRVAVMELQRKLEERMSKAIRQPLRKFAALIERHAQRDLRDEYRARLALYQALDPLLNGDRTGGIERGYQDMTDNEIARYINAAYRCAAILLRREGMLARAASAALAPKIKATAT